MHERVYLSDIRSSYSVVLHVQVSDEVRSGGASSQSADDGASNAGANSQAYRKSIHGVLQFLVLALNSTVTMTVCYT